MGTKLAETEREVGVSFPWRLAVVASNGQQKFITSSSPVDVYVGGVRVADRDVAVALSAALFAVGGAVPGVFCRSGVEYSAPEAE